MLKEKLAKLINVKSIVTIFLTIAFIVLAFLGKIPQEVYSVYLTVIGFYFGTQIEKKSMEQENKGE